MPENKDINIYQINYVRSTDVIPDGFDDFFSEFLAERQFAWGTNSYSLVSASALADEVKEYIEMLQEESDDSDKDKDGRDITLLMKAYNYLNSLPNNVYVDLES